MVLTFLSVGTSTDCDYFSNLMEDGLSASSSSSLSTHISIFSDLTDLYTFRVFSQFLLLHSVTWVVWSESLPKKTEGKKSLSTTHPQCASPCQHDIQQNTSLHRLLCHMEEKHIMNACTPGTSWIALLADVGYLKPMMKVKVNESETASYLSDLVIISGQVTYSRHLL